MKKLLYLIFAVGMIGLFAGCSPAPDMVPAAGSFAGNHSPMTIDVLTARGMVESVESRNVYTTLGFLVERVYAEVGDQVVEGQVLAVLDTEDLALMIAQQRLELATIQHMLEIIPPQREAELETIRRMADLAPRQQRSELEVLRQHNHVAVQETQRMLDEASANLENNTNLHILQAESALTAAGLNLTAVRRSYEIARADYNSGTNPQLASAESALNSARIGLETTEANHQRFQLLYDAGGLSRNDLRQSENALIHAQNAYNDARTNLENAAEMERRGLEQLETALQAAVSVHREAETLLGTMRLAANQELEMLRGNLRAAEIAANLEPMEIAINMSSMEITSNLVAIENAIALELIELNAALELTEISLQLLERQMADSVVTAPISGTVTTVVAREGAIGAGLMFVVEDTDNLRVITRFREYDIALIEAGMDVAVRADATGDAIHDGIVRRINPAADMFSPVVEFEVEVAIPSQDTGLRIGMNARVEIALND